MPSASCLFYIPARARSSRKNQAPRVLGPACILCPVPDAKLLGRVGCEVTFAYSVRLLPTFPPPSPIFLAGGEGGRVVCFSPILCPRYEYSSVGDAARTARNPGQVPFVHLRSSCRFVIVVVMGPVSERVRSERFSRGGGSLAFLRSRLASFVLRNRNVIHSFVHPSVEDSACARA